MLHTEMNSRNSTPWWMTIIILLAMSPALVFPFIQGEPLADEADLSKALMWFYPAYVIAAGLCAWLAYPKRPEMSWILIVLLLLSHGAMYVLKTGTL